MGRHPTPPSDPDPVSSEDASASSPSATSSPPLFYVTFGFIVGGVAVVQRFENAALLLGAFPIVGLTLLSKTEFGANLERNILDRRPALEAIARDVERARAAAREPILALRRGETSPRRPAAAVSRRNPRRRLRIRPSRFSGDCEALDRAVELELIHARWAMLGVVGAATPEALDATGALRLAEPVWWKVGAAKLSGENLDYLTFGGFVIAGKQGWRSSRCVRRC